MGCHCLSQAACNFGQLRLSSFRPVPVALYWGYKIFSRIYWWIGKFTQWTFGSKWFKLWIIYIYIHLRRTTKSPIKKDSASHRVLCMWKMHNERNTYQSSHSIWWNWRKYVKVKWYFYIIGACSERWNRKESPTSTLANKMIKYWLMW